MAKVKFYLKSSPNPEKSIFAKFHFKYSETDISGNKFFKFLKYSTGETINPKYWNDKTQRATNNFREHAEFNTRLNDIETAINDVHRRMLNDGEELTPETLKNSLIKHLEKLKKKVVSKPKKIYFLDFIKLIIEESKEGKRLTKETGGIIKKNTIKGYNTLQNNLIEYESATNKKLTFEDINLTFYKEYLTYLNKKNYTTNTIGARIKNIKVFMNIAKDRNLTKQSEFEKVEFKTIKEDVQTIYLNEQELQKIYKLDLSNNKRLDAVRDLFIIGCYTGLRFSDLKQIQLEHFINDQFIKISTIKTSETVVIPLHWTVKEILKKYENKLPRIISNQKMNDYIKELGKIAEINETVIIRETKGGLRIDKKHKKYSLITVHTARRSFATNMFLADVPTLSIMKITGHRTEGAFLKYIKVSPEENANKLLNHPFFNQSKGLKIAN